MESPEMNGRKYISQLSRAKQGLAVSGIMAFITSQDCREFCRFRYQHCSLAKLKYQMLETEPTILRDSNWPPCSRMKDNWRQGG